MKGKNGMIFFDLDGVIRDLTYYIRGTEPRTDWHGILPNGETVGQYIDNNLNTLITAPPTPYLDVIKQLKQITILTNQPGPWQYRTLAWIEDHFYGNKIDVFFVKKMKDKMSYLHDGDLLVEDYPHYDNYSQIVLIDHPYNRNVKNPYLRITSPDQLALFLACAYQDSALLRGGKAAYDPCVIGAGGVA